MAPSLSTANVWPSRYTRHVIRMETVLWTVNFLGLIFAIAASVMYSRNIDFQRKQALAYYNSHRGKNGYRYVYYPSDQSFYNYEKSARLASYLVPPCVTLVVTTLNQFLYFKKCLHPVYTLVLSIFFLLGWIVAFLFTFAGFGYVGYYYGGYGYGYDYEDDARPPYSPLATIGVHYTMVAFFTIMMPAWFSYMVISAVGVDGWRKAKHIRTHSQGEKAVPVQESAA